MLQADTESVRCLCGEDRTVVFVAGAALIGNFNGSSANNGGSNGNWWSSSVNSGTNAYNLNMNSSNMNPQNNNNKGNSFAVRCVAR